MKAALQIYEKDLMKDEKYGSLPKKKVIKRMRPISAKVSETTHPYLGRKDLLKMASGHSLKARPQLQGSKQFRKDHYKNQKYMVLTSL